MADAWHGPTLNDQTLAFGPLALIAPLLQRLDLAAIIDRHLPPDPQLAFSHGRILSLLLAARLCQPTALINIPAWAARTGSKYSRRYVIFPGWRRKSLMLDVTTGL